MNTADRKLLKSTAAKIDLLLHNQEHDQQSTEEMLDEMAMLRDTIEDHLKPKKRKGRK